ncbi:hypothetical protein [Rubneribacter badeniensis]|uniref:hypothetical protein n=1 Tax=Rubneribacter badeniensis TaxID=2070688 RepID=UPI003A92CAFB
MAIGFEAFRRLTIHATVTTGAISMMAASTANTLTAGTRAVIVAYAIVVGIDETRASVSVAFAYVAHAVAILIDKARAISAPDRAIILRRIVGSVDARFTRKRSRRLGQRRIAPSCRARRVRRKNLGIAFRAPNLSNSVRESDRGHDKQHQSHGCNDRESPLLHGCSSCRGLLFIYNTNELLSSLQDFFQLATIFRNRIEPISTSKPCPP